MSEERTRPTGLWVVAILAICLGGLGSCGGTFQVVSAFMQDAMAELQRDLEPAGQDPRLSELNREMQEDMLEIARDWRIPQVITQVLNLVVSLTLMVGGILLFRWHPLAPTLVIGAIAGSIAVDLATAGLGLFVQLETMGVMNDYMARVGELGGDPAAERVMSSAMRAGGTLGVCFIFGWLVAKLGAYAGSIIYLRKETVRALFA